MVPQIIGYIRKKGYKCGGKGVAATWNDGTNSNRGIVTGFHNCMKSCNAHRECAGFAHYPFYGHAEHDMIKTDICVLRTLLNPIEDKIGQVDCYIKSNGTDYFY